jgi:hypothetical protein
MPNNSPSDSEHRVAPRPEDTGLLGRTSLTDLANYIQFGGAAMWLAGILWLAIGQLHGVLFGVVLGVLIALTFILIMIRTYVVLSRPSESVGEWLPPHKTGELEERPRKLNQADFEKQGERIKELEGEIAALEKARQYASDLYEKARDDNEVLLASLISKTTDLESYEWLHTVVRYQLNGLRKYVLVGNCTVNVNPFSEGRRYLEITFNLQNFSMFHVSIPMPVDAVIEGSIHFKGEMLSGVAKLVVNKVAALPPYGINTLTIRQWVNTDEVTDISETLKVSGNLFDFSKAIVYIKADEFPDMEAAKLDLTRGMQDAELENEIIRLKAELEGEGARRESLKAQYDANAAEHARRARIVRSLNYARGAALIVMHQIGEDEPVSKGTLQYLASVISPVLENYFDESRIFEWFGDTLQNIPDTPLGQEAWVRGFFATLGRLIEQHGG